MAKSLRYRLLHRIRRRLGLKRDDDFDWALYDHKYQAELDDIAREYTQILEPGHYEFSDGHLTARDESAKPLHPNARLLYETLLRLAPARICEFGCGGGDHLANLHLLMPDVELFGLDRAKGQLALQRRRHPNLNATVMRHDIAQPLPGGLPPVDVAFTQAVLMHIHTGDTHLEGLANLFVAARRAVVLMENWTRHSFLEDVRRLEVAGRIPWDEVHVHYRESPEFKRPHIMVVSAVALPDAPVLADYALLYDPLRAKPPADDD